MRLAGQRKMGFYPAPPEAIALAASRLRAPGRPFALLDPCAGEGLAVRQLAELLGCRPADVHAIELDEGRAEALRANLPGSQTLAPASFFGCKITPGTVSLAWVNPPFDDGYGGHRVEADFIHAAAYALKTGGVIMLACPEDQVNSYYGDVPRAMAQWFDRVTVAPYPEDARKFGEVVVYGVKRRLPRDVPAWNTAEAWRQCRGEDGEVYDVPPGHAPKRFEKVEMTDAELTRALAASPLRRRLERAEPFAPPSPPLELGAGHVALLLASGHLDGLVDPEGEAPHVVRGTARKVEYVSSTEETENADGSTTTRTIVSERIQLVVRAVGPDGEIRTFLEGE